MRKRGRKSERGDTCLSCGKIKLTDGWRREESLKCVCDGERDTCRLNENIAFGLQIRAVCERKGKEEEDTRRWSPAVWNIEISCLFSSFAVLYIKCA